MNPIKRKYGNLLSMDVSKKFLVLLTLAGVAIIYLTIKPFNLPTILPFRLSHALRNEILNESHVILFWGDSIFSHKPEDISGPKLFSSCPKLNCTLSFNKDLLLQSEAVIFPWYDMNVDAELPVQRPYNQLWTFFNLESPLTQKQIKGEERYKKFSDIFNISMTYRRDSQIYAPYSLIKITKKKATKKSKEALYKTIKNKSKMAAWFVSNHELVFSKRDSIVDQLKEHGVGVDIYGASGLSCPRDVEKQCLEMLDKKYKFYFSFENSNCKDYITEKFYKVLNLNVVPVVLGGGNYKAVAPKNSFIDVSTFPSVKALADHLKMLDKNDTMYFEYLKWKLESTIQTTDFLSSRTFCNLCKFMTKARKSGRRFRLSIEKWWVNSQCLQDNDQFNRTIINKVYNYV